jgi:tetratricopeptide (TPR) repeat protein/TolB-like protein
VATQDVGSGPVAAPEGDPRRPAFTLGQRFGERYAIVEQVGSGGMGNVFKAIDSQMGRTVALKLIRSDVMKREGSLMRFKRELALAQTVSHPNVYRVHDLGEVDGAAYISMEFIDGESLDDLIHSMGHLSPRQTVAIGKQVCGGLQAIHDKAIVHRDLKPSNIMIDHAGIARLMDFGLAYQTGSEHLTSAGQVLGTMAYLSPEQARGERVGPPSDVFAMGLILYEMLTGRRPPGDGKPLPLSLRGTSEPCPKPSQFVPEIPKTIDSIVMRCLERDPVKRFPSAEVLRAALDALGSGQTSKVNLRSLSRGSGAFVVERTRRWPWIVAGCCVFIASVAVALAWRSRSSAPAGSDLPPVLGIVPFTTSGADATAADFSTGLADGLAIDIGDGGCASVVPRPEIARLEQPGSDARAIARKLGLTHVLMGSLGRVSSGYRVEMHLVASTGNVVSRVVDSDSDAFALQRRLADGIVGALCVGWEPATRPRSAGTTNSTAFLEYSHGLSLLDRPDQAESIQAAIASLERAVVADPKFALAQAALGEAYLAEYRRTADGLLPGKALNAATEALRVAPKQPRVRLLYARVKREMGENEAAARELRSLVDERPRDPEAHAALAALYVEQAAWSQAVTEYAEAQKLRPDYWGSYARLGYAYFRMGHLKDAITAYTKSTQLQPDNAQGWQMLGSAYQAEGNLKSAADSYRRSIDIRPESMVFLNLGTIYFDDGDFAAAKVAYERAIGLDERRSAVWRGLGDAQQMLGQALAARRAWAECARLATLDVSLNKENSVALAEAAVCEVKLGNVSQARLDIERAVAQSPRDGEVLYQWALVLAIEGRADEAVSALRRSIDNGYPAKRASRDYEFRKLRDLEAFRKAVEVTSASGG